MNLIQQAEQLKNLPDQALAQMQQRPTDMPPYLVVAEMQRRTNMRKAYQGAQGSPMNQPPVVQQMGQQFAQQSQQQPQGQPPPMQMAGGGLASLARYYDGGQVLPPVDPSMLGMSQFPGYSTMNDSRFNEMRGLKRNPAAPRSQAEYFKEMQAQMGESPLTAIAAKLEGEEAELRGKKPKLSQILMQLGLGMAASRRPDLAGAVGEGGIQALQGYAHERDRNQTLADRIAEKRLRAIEGAQRHSDRIQDYAVDAARSAQSGYNTDRANDTNIELGIMRQAKEEELASRLADRQITAQQAQMELAEFNKRADAERRMAELQFGRETQERVQRIRNERPRGDGGDKAEDRKDAKEMRLIGGFNAMANNYAKEAATLERRADASFDKKVKDQLLAQAEELHQKASALRTKSQAQLERMLGGVQPARGSDLGTGSLFAPIPNFSKPGGGTRGMPAPLFIPPPPRR